MWHKKRHLNIKNNETRYLKDIFMQHRYDITADTWPICVVNISPVNICKNVHISHHYAALELAWCFKRRSLYKVDWIQILNFLGPYQSIPISYWWYCASLEKSQKDLPVCPNKTTRMCANCTRQHSESPLQDCLGSVFCSIKQSEKTQTGCGSS